MTLTYIYHSGFMLEGLSAILIFDFWRDADNVSWNGHCPQRINASTFQASHFHQAPFQSGNPEPARTPRGKESHPLPRHLPSAACRNGRRNGIPETERKLPRRPHHGTCFRFHRFRCILVCSCGRQRHIPCRRPEQLALGRRIHATGNQKTGR